MIDHDNVMLPRSTVDRTDPIAVRALDYLDQMAKSGSSFSDPHWSFGAVTRWIQERKKGAVDGWTVSDDELLDTLSEILEALQSGEITALGQYGPEPTMRPIPIETWAIYQIGYYYFAGGNLLTVCIVSDSTGEPCEEFSNVRIYRGDVLNRWPSGNQLAGARRDTTVADETRCFHWLSTLMTTNNPIRPKSSVKAEAMQRFRQLSARGFDRAWNRAIERTGAYDWRRPGRRRIQGRCRK